MTVAELIAKLRELPGDLPVQVEGTSEMDGCAFYSDPSVFTAPAGVDVAGLYSHYLDNKPNVTIVVIR